MAIIEEFTEIFLSDCSISGGDCIDCVLSLFIVVVVVFVTLNTIQTNEENQLNHHKKSVGG